MSLQESAILIKLVIRQWDGFKKDKAVSDRVDVEFKTTGSAGSYNKRLLPKHALAPVQSVIARLRAEHMRYTMPWRYDGVSILPTKLFFKYTEAMRQVQDDLDKQVSNLVTQYPIYKANQATALGAMFNPDDYPSAEEVRAKFGVSFTPLPVPQADHFIVDLEEDTMAKLKANLTKELAAANTMVLAGLYERLKDSLDHVHERLNDPENVFRDSLMSNLELLVDLMPGLNVYNDPGLERVCTILKDKVLITSAQRLRDDVALRAQVSNAAYDAIGVLRGELTKITKGN